MGRRGDLASGSSGSSLGSPSKDRTTKLLAVLGVVALGLTIIALITASLTALSFLTLDVVLLFVLRPRGVTAMNGTQLGDTTGSLRTWQAEVDPDPTAQGVVLDSVELELGETP